MNKQEASKLIEHILDDDRDKQILEILEIGLANYKEALRGTSHVNEYHQSNYKNRLLSSTVFSAFDEHLENDAHLTPQHEKQRSSHRTYLLFENAWIDIVKAKVSIAIPRSTNESIASRLLFQVVNDSVQYE